MLQHVIESAEKRPDLVEIYLHVQVSNEDALGFYKRHDFAVVQRLENYYKRIEPPHCFVVARKVVYKSPLPPGAEKKEKEAKEKEKEKDDKDKAEKDKAKPAETAAEKLKKKKRR